MVVGVYELQAGEPVSFTSGTIGINQLPLGSATVARTPSVQTITVNASSTDLHGSFQVVNSGEISMAIDVYSSAAQMAYILTSMLTLDDVTVSLYNHTLKTEGAVEYYGVTWSITFPASHYQSLLGAKCKYHHYRR